MNDTEEWRAIPSYEGYEVSSFGRVRSIPRTREGISNSVRHLKGIILRVRPILQCGNYLYVTLSNVHMPKARLHARVACLVAEAFIGPRPKGLCVCHNDGNSHNNRPENLRYDTVKNNMADKVIHGTLLFGERCSFAKVTNKDVSEIRSLQGKKTGRALAKQFGVSPSQISRILLKQRRVREMTA
jgi:NUMOD4 motif/HNH endonuclease